MYRPTVRFPYLLAVAFGATAVSTLSAQPRYTVDPIEAPADGFALYPSAINNAGFVVGWWYGSPVTNRQPFIYSQDTGYNLLPMPAEKEFSVPMDINDAGVIVGFADASWTAYDPQGWKLENGQFSLFPANTHAVEINESGLIAGMSCEDPSFGTMGCVFLSDEPPAMQSIPAVAGYAGSMDRGIVLNDLGQTAYRTGPTTAVFRDADGTTIPLPPPPSPWTGIRVEGINNDGQVIARWTRSSTLSGSIRRYSLGFVWSAETGMQEFGVTAGSIRPRGINDHGQVIIESGTHDQAFFDCWVWSEEAGAVNLDNRTDYGSNLVLTDLYDINNAGQIVAGGDTITPPADIYLVLNPNTPTACAADFDLSGEAEVPDIFAYLSAWFASDAAADIDGTPGVAVPDIFAFLSLWFAGC